jgi:hypothetical protein
MWDLIKAEWLRFRGWAMALAILHLAVLGFLSRLMDLAQQPLLVFRLFAGVYALAGLLLGLYQMGTYRRPSSWLNLLHRPLPHWQVATALLGASAALLSLAVLLPLLVIAGWQDVLSTRVFDMRHWLLPLSAWLIAFFSYLIGSYCMLAGRRYAAGALAFLLVLATIGTTGTAAVAMQALLVLWLVAMVFVAFKPDLGQTPQSAPAIVLTALPLQLAVYMAFGVLAITAEMIWIAQGSHPLNTSEPIPGSLIELSRMEPKDRMLAGLSAATTDEAALLREQVALSEVTSLSSQISQSPVRNGLSNATPTMFVDDKRHLEWTFSHDSMRFEGRGVADGKRVESLGIGESNVAFASPALPAGQLPGMAKGDRILIAGNTAYQYNSVNRQVLPRIQLPDGEMLTGMQPIGQSFAVLSNRGLYFFDGRDVVGNSQLLTPRLRLPIPGPYGDLDNIELIELVDGYLVSFSFLAYAHEIFSPQPYQLVVRADNEGDAVTVARREVPYAFPALHRYRMWIPSPVIHALANLPEMGISAPDPIKASAWAPAPDGIKWTAGILLLLSAAGAIWLTGRQALSTMTRVVWVLACAIIGLPALICLWLFYPSRERLDGSPAGVTASA